MLIAEVASPSMKQRAIYTLMTLLGSIIFELP